MSPKRKRHGLPLQPEIPQFWATFLHIMTRQDLNLHLVITSWITTTIWQDFSTGIINYRFLTTETNLKTLYIYFVVFFTTSSVKLFVVNVKIFVYNCVFGKKEKEILMKSFTFWKWKHISKKEPHFGNESSFWNPFWQWKHVFGEVKSTA